MGADGESGSGACADAVLAFLSGRGEMAERIRRFDWASSPLGPAERWPQSLRSAVSILLPSKAQIVLFWGPHLVALYNDAYRPVFGAKHPWALGRPARECWREVWDVLRPLFERVMVTGEAFWAQDHPFYLERHGYPEETYFDVSYDPVRDETGAVGGVFCIVSETTGRVLGERRLRTLRELGSKTTAQRVDAVFQGAAEALATNPADIPYALLYLLEHESRLRLVATSGVVPEDEARGGDLGDSAAWLAPFVEASRTGVPVVALPSLVAGCLPEAASPDQLLVHPIVSGTGVAGFLVGGLSRFLALTGGYRDFFGLVADRISTGVASARALEEERRRAEALAELDRLKTTFFSNVSHEFRTPLTLMLGPLQDLLADGGGAPVAVPRQQVESLHRNALRLLKHVNSLLDFARIEAGRVQAVYEPTDLGPITAELAGVFRSAIERANLRFLVDCPSLPEPVYVDREMWEKIVLNLLSNALKFTFGGGIAVRLIWRGDHAALEIADTGTGIPAEEVPNLFQRFHRIQEASARTHEGTGIGLALVHELVRMHGGAVEVESTPGRGSTFRVRMPAGTAHLPADRIGTRRTLASTAVKAVAYLEEALRWLPVEPGEAPSSAPAPPSAPSESAGPPARILVAEDNADLRDYLRRILGARWEVEAVADGAAALAATHTRLPDLVLTDVMMPGLDGFALLRELRRDPRTHAIPVVMLSARAGEESRIEGLGAGADEYLVKPFSARELVARVGAQLDRAAARKAEITEQIRARRQTEAARQAAEAASHAKDEFLAVLGHELRNPLGAIQNAISALQQLGVPSPEAGRLHAIIVRQAAHLSRLMDDLLDVSRVTAGKIALRRGVVDLAEVADRCVTALRQTGRLDGHRLEVRAERVVVDGDPARLEQVIGNLLDNALKYTPPGGHIGLRVGPEGGVAVLRVRDSGVGLDPEHLASIFEPFVQAHASLDRTAGGLGLGLALVRRLVEIHGGTVVARSEGPGRGSEFEVRIPALPTGAATAHVPAVSRPAVGPRRVLIVEDHVDARQGLRLLLELDGHSVEEAADGWEGLRRLLAWRPDVALVDVGLPGLDGYALARAARRSPECGPTRLVALTGYGQPDDRRRALEAGFDAHLVKPVTEAALADVLAGSRGASTAPRELQGAGSSDERVDSRESRPSGP